MHNICVVVLLLGLPLQRRTLGICGTGAVLSVGAGVLLMLTGGGEPALGGDITLSDKPGDAQCSFGDVPTTGGECTIDVCRVSGCVSGITDKSS